jgi:gluconate 2-dehydrogenase alpha chain
VAERAVIVGSGAGASVAAMVLSQNGWDVLVLEKGPRYIQNLEHGDPTTVFSNDELKASRYFEVPDPYSEPRVYRTAPGSEETVGAVNPLASCVGGGTVHWDAKTPRFWDIDFKKLSMLGPFPGADIGDWPFSYEEIAPYYVQIEKLMCVSGSQAALPAAPTLKYAPGERGFVMPPGPMQLSSKTVAGGLEAIGLHPYAFPMAINSQPYDGRPACNNCGQCSSYGCPLNARIGALAVMRHALHTGRVEIRDSVFVSQIVYSGRKATGVKTIGAKGRPGFEKADLVVLAASGIESARLALLSHLPNPHDRIGRNLMFHNFIDGFGIFLNERMHANRGRSTSMCCEDLADPAFPAAIALAKANGIPYVRGGIMEVGGTQEVIAESNIYRYILELLNSIDPKVLPFGRGIKELMRASILRDRLSGISLIGEDLPYADNRVTLSKTVKDYRGVPVPEITYNPGQHEQVAQELCIPVMTAGLKAAGAAAVSAAVPESLSEGIGGGAIPHGAHIMGGMRMGTDPRLSVTDAHGMVHGMDNVFVADGSVFPSSGAQNPTLTIMATALRNATALFA